MYSQLACDDCGVSLWPLAYAIYASASFMQAMGELFGGLTQIDFMKGLAGMQDMASVLAVLQQIGMDGCGTAKSTSLK